MSSAACRRSRARAFLSCNRRLSIWRIMIISPSNQVLIQASSSRRQVRAPTELLVRAGVRLHCLTDSASDFIHEIIFLNPFATTTAHLIVALGVKMANKLHLTTKFANSADKAAHLSPSQLISNPSPLACRLLLIKLVHIHPFSYI